jgi:hypothetical protein
MSERQPVDPLKTLPPSLALPRLQFPDVGEAPPKLDYEPQAALFGLQSSTLLATHSNAGHLMYKSHAKALSMHYQPQADGCM